MQNKYTINDIEIYIPTYNRPEFLKQSLESLVNQTSGIPKITVFNNGTLPETSNVIASFNKYGVVEYKSHGGLIECMEKVSENLQSKYVMFFHDDDILNSKYLEYALQALNKYDDIAFITTCTKNFTTPKSIDFSPATDEHYLFKSQEKFAQFMYINEQIAMQTAIYRTDLFKKFPRETEKYGKFFDWPYLVTLSNEGNVVLFSDKNMFNVRIHKGQWTNDEKSSWTIKSLTNWHKQFFEAMNVSNKGSIGYYMFYSRFKTFFSGGYYGLICKKYKDEISFEEALEFAKKEIGIDDKDIIYGKNSFVPVLQNLSKKNNYFKSFEDEELLYKVDDIEKYLLFNMIEYQQNFINVLFLQINSKKDFRYYLKKIFSIRNSNDKKHKILTILGIKMNFKKKRKGK